MVDIIGQVAETEEDTLKNRYLTFSLGQETYGLEVEYVTEIVGFQKITEIPELPEYLKGVINLRGKIIPVMDVRLRFKKEPKEYNDRTCIIVIDINGASVGLIVDAVSEVIAIPEENQADPPQLNKEVKNKCIKKIGKAGNDIKLLIDCEKLLSKEEILEMKKII
ncbi:chemotaxis protein CheW [Thermoclostridium stercorarium subsp. stercorarium DSM 8532]|jgi:purine-binding chemotaxis protein CheW|uniref:Chemotaxis protein CheW n=3 Tax=Thermoclostridium stercorarium TaxID=1510 RepID=L7VKZ7_THES1|nr:chemotaxis protein CheW [Thermoclostridium stercorarium]AGC68825.1 chemotaxis protein CheW [Thermoclostridium stercorarium subsp. stercorarium DSM 8532]AGI39824.1 chemotaxis signal transduction protein [Thermoclostridium stercorarium subsp. stercorarium DSM 8532]ANW99133.1 chemotaxis protein CheW [Thermoclostridium stercorarium subsp. thermolacticum DSM 2910]ANX01697.1 chemotaxis protein CheW [Thermoclostridium stercorarium subsp. leptospartum DSM 9219]UZQ84819.1 chemotaxis protein CheW [Th